MMNKLTREYNIFKTYPKNMRILLITNLLYSLVLPVIELFIGAYIMRNSKDPTLVVAFQLALYTGIPFTFAINGYLLRYVKIQTLYSLGMILSGVSMGAMMYLDHLSMGGIVIAGLIMGVSYGFFWANRDILALESTNNDNRNYYYGLETFFYTLTAVVVPYMIGAFIGASESHNWFGSNINVAYRIITACVFVITIISSIIVFKGDFKKPEGERFIFFKYDKLWTKMIRLAVLKGLAQGFIVTAPAMLIMKLVGNEGDLGLIQSIGAIISAILLYILGRISKPKDRLLIFSTGLILFAVGALVNGFLYSSMGVLLFMLCLVLARPLLDIAYFPIQLNVIDIVSALEKRNSFAYLLNHEFGLYIGRLLGCGMFIVLSQTINSDFALRYALIIVALLQLISIPMSKRIIKDCDVYTARAENNIK